MGAPTTQWGKKVWPIVSLAKSDPDVGVWPIRDKFVTYWEAILQANNVQGPLTLRVNRRRLTRDDYLKRLAEMNIGASAHPYAPDAVTLAESRSVDKIPGFNSGQVSVQDASAQLAVELLDPAPGQRVLDACAAPGGKTAHILELADAHVIALDIDPARCERIHDNLRRQGLQAHVLTGDAGQPSEWWDGEPFDAILLDAPCTASGIVRRHPDVRWLRRESDIAQLAAVQARLLAVLWPLLRPGGRLLYCTCSVFRAEGEAQVQTFLAHNTGAVLRPAPGHLLPQSGAKADAVPDNLKGDHDGFFYALLEKRAGPAPA